MPEESSPELGSVAQIFCSFQPILGQARPMASPGSQTSGCIVCAQLGCRPGRVSWELPSASEGSLWPPRPCLAPLFFADRDLATSLEPLSGLRHHPPKASRAQVRAVMLGAQGGRRRRVLEQGSRWLPPFWFPPNWRPCYTSLVSTCRSLSGSSRQ